MTFSHWLDKSPISSHPISIRRMKLIKKGSWTRLEYLSHWKSCLIDICENLMRTFILYSSTCKGLKSLSHQIDCTIWLQLLPIVLTLREKKICLRNGNLCITNEKLSEKDCHTWKGEGEFVVIHVLRKPELEYGIRVGHSGINVHSHLWEASQFSLPFIFKEYFKMSYSLK